MPTTLMWCRRDAMCASSRNMLGEVVIGRQQRVHRLDREQPLQAGLVAPAGQVHVAHAAGAQPVDQIVLIDARHRRRGRQLVEAARRRRDEVVRPHRKPPSNTRIAPPSTRREAHGRRGLCLAARRRPPGEERDHTGADSGGRGRADQDVGAPLRALSILEPRERRILLVLVVAIEHVEAGPDRRAGQADRHPRARPRTTRATVPTIESSKHRPARPRPDRSSPQRAPCGGAARSTATVLPARASTTCRREPAAPKSAATVCWPRLQIEDVLGRLLHADRAAVGERAARRRAAQRHARELGPQTLQQIGGDLLRSLVAIAARERLGVRRCDRRVAGLEPSLDRAAQRLGRGHHAIGQLVVFGCCAEVTRELRLLSERERLRGRCHARLRRAGDASTAAAVAATTASKRARPFPIASTFLPAPRPLQVRTRASDREGAHRTCTPLHLLAALSFRVRVSLFLRAAARRGAKLAAWRLPTFTRTSFPLFGDGELADVSKRNNSLRLTLLTRAPSNGRRGGCESRFSYSLLDRHLDTVGSGADVARVVVQGLRSFARRRRGRRRHRR